MNNKKCKVDGCERVHYGLGYCKNHYRAFKKYGEDFINRDDFKVYEDDLKKCKVEGCNGTHKAQGYCERHYDQIRKHGTILPDEPKICKFEGCCKPHFGLGYCEKHYKELKYYGEVKDNPPRPKIDKTGICKAEGCDKPPCTSEGYCEKHYNRLKKFGDPNIRTVHDPNEIIIHEDYAEMLLYDKNCEVVGSTKIDLDDIDKVKNIKWGFNNHGYVKNKIHGSLHRFIMQPPDDMVVDHINHDKTDNRKQNLRICTNQENTWNSRRSIRNTSGFKGVSKVKGAYVASIIIDGKNYYLGRFNNKKDALEAYNAKARELQGEFACLDEYIEDNSND